MADRYPLRVACRLSAFLSLTLTVFLAGTPAWGQGSAEQARDTRAARLPDLPTLEAILPELADKRVVFVGESHTSFAHHMNQLAIVRGLHERVPALAIGVEYFQRPFQDVLDRYVAGEISTEQMLLESEYFRRWRFDFRHYAAIFEFAREHRIPIIALNASHELTTAVSREGLHNLNEAQRGELPEGIDRNNHDYRERLRAVFDQHPSSGDFESFHQVQLVWDETMAETAADYLAAHPETQMVILAGHGHLAYGDGIPQRLVRRLKVDAAIVLNDWSGPLETTLADYLLLAPERELPPRGQLGVLLEPAEQDDGVLVRDLDAQGPAAGAGVKAGDRILRIGEQPVSRPSEIHAMLWSSAPGDEVELILAREDGEARVQVTLDTPPGQGPPMHP